MAGDTLRSAKAAKRRDRDQRATRRSIGVVVSVSIPLKQAQVDIGERTIPAVIPASVIGVVAGVSVVVRLGGTPVVEAVL